MTDLALPAPSAPPATLWSAATGTAHAVRATATLGLRTFIAVPLLIAIAVLPELAQHVAEIKLGMFGSREAFRAGAEDPLRWFFAYPKIAGFALTILLVARYWAVGSVRAALLVRPLVLLRILFAIGLTLLAELPFAWLADATGSPALDVVAGGASIVVQAGLLVYLAAALLEDNDVTLRSAFATRLPTAFLIALLAALAFLPTQWLHTAHHLAALGQASLLVWLLMIWDSLWVGMMAALLGSALFVGFRAGPTWRGWSADPRSI